jgi:hypothetical protein
LVASVSTVAMTSALPVLAREHRVVDRRPSEDQPQTDALGSREIVEPSDLLGARDPGPIAS